MYKNVQTNPEKSPKIDTTLLLFYVDMRNFLKAMRGNGYHFVPKLWRYLPKTIMLVVRSSGLWESYAQTYPKWDKKIPTACWGRSMIACQVSCISEKFWILKFKTRYLNVCGRVTVAGCLKFIPVSCMGHKHPPMDTYMILQPIHGAEVV